MFQLLRRSTDKSVWKSTNKPENFRFMEWTMSSSYINNCKYRYIFFRNILFVQHFIYSLYPNICIIYQVILHSSFCSVEYIFKLFDTNETFWKLLTCIKGQLILKANFEVFIWTIKPMKIASKMGQIIKIMAHYHTN